MTWQFIHAGPSNQPWIIWTFSPFWRPAAFLEKLTVEWQFRQNKPLAVPSYKDLWLAGVLSLPIFRKVPVPVPFSDAESVGHALFLPLSIHLTAEPCGPCAAVEEMV